ncbi:MAG TPA: hypothetical protein VN723_08435 [Rhizomicrobium sp.]|nr:hypothetical protein [Rhizomicrobium sp.]
MTPIVALFSILAAQALGAISPGPSFLFVTRTSVAMSRKDGRRRRPAWDWALPSSPRWRWWGCVR